MHKNVKGHYRSGCPIMSKELEEAFGDMVVSMSSCPTARLTPLDPVKFVCGKTGCVFNNPAQPVPQNGGDFVMRSHIQFQLFLKKAPKTADIDQVGVEDNDDSCADLSDNEITHDKGFQQGWE